MTEQAPETVHASTCKHCGKGIGSSNGQFWIHLTGKNRNLHRCSPEDSGLPYGYEAEHVNQPCWPHCLGSKVEDQPETVHGTMLVQWFDPSGKLVAKAEGELDKPLPTFPSPEARIHGRLQWEVREGIRMTGAGQLYFTRPGKAPAPAADCICNDPECGKGQTP